MYSLCRLIKGLFQVTYNKPDAVKRWFLLGIRIAVSLVILFLLVRFAWNSDVLKSFKSISFLTIISASICILIGIILNSYRWQKLLQRAGIDERLGFLTSLYFISLFFSLFLPSTAGGDAVRVFEIARRNKLPAEAFITTLQDRAIGLSALMLIGLVATTYYFSHIPTYIGIWAIILQIVGVIVCFLLFHLTPLIKIAKKFPKLFDGLLWRRISISKYTAFMRNRKMFSPEDVQGVDLNFFLLVGVSVLAMLISIGSTYILGLTLTTNTSFGILCLVMPLVGIVKMLPISLNGIGVGEGAFVYLMGIMTVPQDKALAIALASLALQTFFALFGGLLLTLRIMRRTWVSIEDSVK
jgi:glycosyltransferase 2 family protein